MAEPQKSGRPAARRRTKRALERKEMLKRELMAGGASEVEAEAEAQKQMRDNPRGDWRDG